MILGIDHLAISTDKVEDSARRLSAAGYETSFVETDLLNAKAKEPFLRRFHPRHAIALCRHPSGIAIEWTDHQSQTANVGPYQVLTDQELPLPTYSRTDEDDAFPWIDSWKSTPLTNGTASNDLATTSTAVVTATKVTAPRGIAAVGIEVADLERSLRFWQIGLQCRLIERGTTDTACSWAKLTFRALRPTWSLEVVLVESTPIARSLPMLDDQGATCLALLSTDCESDAVRAGSASGGSTSQTFTLTVAEKPLRIALVRGPDGEIVEIIQP